MNSLLLFDIDGTLIDTEGAGLVSLEEGLYRSFPDRREISFPALDLGGATDGSVVGFLFEHFRIDDHDRHREQFFHHYEEALERKLIAFREKGKGRILPGIPALLSELAGQRQDFVLALLTGNTESGARIKLSSFGLDSYFSFGAFGSDHHDRNELGPIALQRAGKRTGKLFPSGRALVIGDTGKDVACARACGAKILAVATGAATLEELERHSPDALLPDLSDTRAVVDQLAELLETTST